MPLVIAGATSGSTTVQATDAVTATITLPSATTTLAGTTTPSFTTTIGVGAATPSTSGAGITFPATQSASTDAIGLSVPKQPVRAEDDTDETFADKEAQYTTDKAIFDEALEAARQLVDRIAFAGQVPVNVLGATAGQYIIPVNDNGAIKGEAVLSPTFEQYQTAVGKVIAIESDGRARIIVKVA